MEDFKLFLKEINFTEEQLEDWMIYMDKYYLLKTKSNVYYKKKSTIQGYGIFLTNNIKKEEYLDLAIINDKRTLLARYSNHSKKPNIEFRKEKNNVVAYALKDINKNEELLVNYRHNKL